MKPTLLACCVRTWLYIFYVTISVGHVQGNAKTNLTLLGFVPVQIPSGGWSAGGMIPAIDMALDDVNNNSDILTNYELRWQWEDDKCNPGYATYLLSELVHKKPQKLAILGGGCSIATAPVAAYSHYYNLVQLSYSTASPQFSDKSTYPLFSRTQLSELASNGVRLAILKHFKWQRVTLLYEDAIFFVQEKDGRIIVVLAYEGHARILFCNAYHLGMYGTEYAYLIPGWYPKNWWKKKEELVNCTQEEMKTVIESTIEVAQLAKDTTNQVTINGETFKQYERRYLRVLQQPRYKAMNMEYHFWHGFGYDTVWAIALALNTSIEHMSQKMVNSSTLTRHKALEDFTYADGEMANIILQALRNTSFRGVSGEVKFDANGDRGGNLAICQMRDGKSVYLGMADFNGTMAMVRGFQWQGKEPPVDGQRLRYITMYIDDELLIASLVFSFFGISLDCVYLCFNIRKRNHGFIKLSSPNMNNITLLGALLVYLSIIPLGLINCRYLRSDHERTISCLVGKWLLSVGFTLGFGPMFAKTWRIHRIVMKVKIRKELIYDKYLIIFVTILLLADVAVFTSWQLIDPCETRLVEVSTELRQDSFTVIKRIYSCSSEYLWVWLGALYGQKGLLLLFGCFLAHETRNIQVDGLNDSRQIGLSIYNIMTASLISITLSLVLVDEPNLAYGFMSVPIFLCCTITLCMMFIEKIRVVWSDPTGVNYVRKRTREGLSTARNALEVSGHVGRINEARPTTAGLPSQKISECNSKTGNVNEAFNNDIESSTKL
ncbi:gamma-aminobutyric acid type B receptor subunit 2-like [Glandiceps talaboti]